MKPDHIRANRITTYYDRACNKKYQTEDGNFSVDLLLQDISNIVSPKTAREYADDVIDRLVQKGYLRI